MAEIFKKLKAGIEDIFPEVEGIELNLETRLGAIPDFDSMAAVNLQTFISETFNVAIPLDLFGEDTTIRDIITLIDHPEKISAAEKKRP